MKLNMGTLDRRLRLFLVAPALVVIALVMGPGGLVPIVLYVVAAVMVGTSLVGSCPLYTLVGVQTCPASSDAARAGVSGGN
ncbi:MAG: DUF2892 domain-containing protein [Nocardioides sp.]|uniref:YgaP family membrane protein n=1 Tax=Nocardioides sp. TaxID=35761 RepID=UPI000C975838|nr:DUF2892 domain-containing protein [Nocardioides sp.]MAS55955.1 hypothetical protein [Pimelobacter sp.]MDE0775500.1 DUF2892 domain-containing protein [Nocardioides sp.]